MLARIKTFFGGDWERPLLALVLILIATLSFGLGRLSVFYQESGGIEILNPVNGSDLMTKDRIPSGGGYVASKTGTKYYLPWCKDVLNIADDNKIYFQTKEEAEARGYTVALNCK